MSEPFKGTVSVDIRDSVPDWAPFEPRKAPAGAPNVLKAAFTKEIDFFGQRGIKYLDPACSMIEPALPLGIGLGDRGNDVRSGVDSPRHPEREPRRDMPIARPSRRCANRGQVGLANVYPVLGEQYWRAI